MATKKNIYIVMEHLAQGELFDKIVRHFYFYLVNWDENPLIVEHFLTLRVREPSWE